MTDPSGFLQLRQRFYWPEVGRFVSRDPIRALTGPYAYCASNPVRRVDPSGEWYWPWEPRPCPTDPWQKCRDQLNTDVLKCNLVAGAEAAGCATGLVICLRYRGNYKACRAIYMVCAALVLIHQATCLDNAYQKYAECMDKAATEMLR